MKEFVIPTLVLAIICLVCTGALSATYSVANPIIIENAQRLADETRQLALTSGENFAPVEGYKPEGNIVDVYEAGNGAGYVVTTLAKGYGGNIKVMTGITSEGVVDQVKVLEINETKGLGSRVADDAYTVSSGKTYSGQYSGLGEDFRGQIETIVGSTISSNAMSDAVALAFEAVNQVKGA